MTPALSSSTYIDPAGSTRGSISIASPYASSPRAAPEQTSPAQSISLNPSQQSCDFSPAAAFDRQQRIPFSYGLDLQPLSSSSSSTASASVASAIASGAKLNLGFLFDHRHDPLLDKRQRPPPMNRTTTNNNNDNGDRSPLAPFLYPSPGLPVPTYKGLPMLNTPMLAHSTPIRNIPPTCPLDALLLDFLADRQRLALCGESPQQLVGPPYPSVSSLLHPSRSLTAHPLSKLFTDILAAFPDLSALPEQVAVLYVMFLIMRWQIRPTPEAYDRLPDWVTPRPAQLFTPHPAWVDHLPWPRMRDKMVQLHPRIPLDNFFIPYTTTLSLNWPHRDLDTLVSVPGSDEMSINPAFERHLRDLANWSLGPAFAKAFPMLVDTTTIKPDPVPTPASFSALSAPSAS